MKNSQLQLFMLSALMLICSQSRADSCCVSPIVSGQFILQTSIAKTASFSMDFTFKTDSACSFDSVKYLETNKYSITSSTFTTGNYAANFHDTFVLTISIDTATAPRVLTQIRQVIYTSRGSVSITGYYYLTPWNTIEFHNDSTASSKKWLAQTAGPSPMDLSTRK